MDRRSGDDALALLNEEQRLYGQLGNPEGLARSKANQAAVLARLNETIA